MTYGKNSKMNILLVQQLARQAGATDAQGGKATTVFCFTADELGGFADRIVKECAKQAQECWENQEEEELHEFSTAKHILNYFGVES